MEPTADLELIDEPAAEPRDETEEDWLGAEDVSDIQMAIDAPAVHKGSPKTGWTVALIASLFLHATLVAAAVTILTRVQSVFRWSVARGSSAAHDSPSVQNQMDGFSPMDPPSISVPSLPKLPALEPPGMETLESPASEEASELPDRLLPPPPVSEPVIGIGMSSAREVEPHFAVNKPPLRLDSVARSSGTADSSATAVITPPRVAGPRGERDGFDSRGLPIPDYPPESRRRGEEGVVVIEVEVLPDGKVGDVRVVSDAGHPRLSAAAVKKLKTATFEPALQGGKPVVGHIVIPYRFTLE